MLRFRLLSLALVALLVSLAEPAIGSSRSPDITAATQAVAATAVSVEHLIGQKLMVAMRGTAPSASLLGRIRRGEIGGVILYGANITSARQLAALTRKLRRAAVLGGQPQVLIATDQEGGAVKRVPWAAPNLSPPDMGALDSESAAFAQGKATGVVLLCAGINNNLAPVADVPSSTSSFMYQEGRTWSFDASVTATLSDAFASGLEAGHGIPTMKHFPGIGFATDDTDSNVVKVTASRAELGPGLRPYRKAIGHHIPLIILSNATYTAYDSANAAGWSRAISIGLLRNTLGFTGVSITDSLNGTAAARGVSATSLAIRAARAGTDMVLLTGNESRTSAAYASLVLAAQNGSIPLARLRASYDRILAMKAGVTGPPADTNPPSVKGPASVLYAGPALGPATTPVRTAWSGTDPCGVSRYTLERRTNDGASGQVLAGQTATSVDQSLTFGSSYDYAVKAMDGAGNTTDWVDGPSFKPTRFQQSDSRVTYRRTWRTVSNRYASGGSLAYSTTSGASATLTFTGYAVSWVAYRGPNRGSAAIYVDGQYQRTVNLYSPMYHARRIVYARHWAGNGQHTLRIVNLGTSGHSRIDVDAFVRLLAQ